MLALSKEVLITVSLFERPRSNQVSFSSSKAHALPCHCAHQDKKVAPTGYSPAKYGRFCSADMDQLNFVQAMLVVLLPTSFFFVFLYYTDMGALTFFLAAYSVSRFLPLLASQNI